MRSRGSWKLFVGAGCLWETIQNALHNEVYVVDNRTMEIE